MVAVRCRRPRKSLSQAINKCTKTLLESMNRLFIRNMWMLRAVVILFTIHYSLFTATAQDDDKTTMFNPVEHAVISQTIAPDARGAGMGDVGVATDPDVTSQYWNPAKYPFCISRAGVALNYTPWLTELYPLAPTVGERYRLGVSRRLLSYRRL